jgi:hypothetical protein
MHTSLHPPQGLVEHVVLNHEREVAFDGFGLSFATQHGLRVSQLRLIELEMFVSSRGTVFHNLSTDFDVTPHSGF